MEGVTFVTEAAAKWGAGKGLPAEPFEIDENFWQLLLRLKALEDNPPQARHIETILHDEETASITIVMSDTATHGPIPLPIAQFEFREPWNNATLYHRGDVIPVLNVGTYLSLRQHVTPEAPTAFDPDAVDDSVTPSQKLYRQIAGIPPVLHYDIAVNYLGLIPGGTVTLAQLVSTRRFWLRAGLPGSQAYLAVPASAALALDLRRNGTSIGSVSFAAGANTGNFTFAADAQVFETDRLTLVGPSAEDVTAADLSVTLIGDRFT